MKRFLFACLTTLFCATTWAQNSGFDDPSSTSYFVVDGIYYYVSGSRVKQCTVTSLYHAELNEANVDTYKGDIVIPDVETITNPKNSTEYTIASLFEDAFAYCSELTSISIPDNRSITSIGSRCFYNCTGLTEITIPSTVTSISNYAFQGCSNLATVTCLSETPPVCDPNTHNVEDHLTFDGIPEDAVLYVPLGCVDAYQNDVIWGYYFIVKEIEDDKEPLADGDKFESDGIYYNVVSAEERRVEVTWGGSSSTSGTDSYTGDLDIPRTVTYDDVTYLVIGIGDYAFYNCSSLTGVTMTDAITYINNSSFWQCVGIESLSLPSSLTSMGNYIFYGCTGLKEITIPDGVPAIGTNLFEGCSNIEKATIGKGVESIGTSAFDSCTSLTAIVIPNAVTTMGASVFKGCSALADVTLGEGLETIGNYAFQNCKALTEITIPENIKTMNYWVFYNCTALETVYYNATECETAGASFFPIFEGCSSLTEAYIGENVMSVPSYLFSECKYLVAVYSYNTTPPSCGSSVFTSNTYQGTLTVPFGTSEDYKEADVWKEFYNIEELPDPVYHPTYDVIPEEGVVESLSVIELTSDILFMGNASGGLVYNGTVSVYKDGQDEAVTTSKSIEGDYIYPEAADHGVVITLNDEITEEGDYIVVIPAGLFYWFNDDDPILNDELTLYYTVQEKGTFVCDVDPADGAKVTMLDQLVFTNPSGGEIFVNEELARDPEIYVYDEAGDVVTTISYFDTIWDNDFTKEYAQIVVFEETVTEGGTYTVSVPAEMFIIYDEDGRAYYSEAMTLTYTIVGSSTGIGGISINDENVEGIYSTSGQKLNSTVKGVNIIRYSDGSVKKIYVK